MADSQLGHPPPTTNYFLLASLIQRWNGYVALQAGEIIIGEHPDHPFLRKLVVAPAAHSAEPATPAIGMLKFDYTWGQSRRDQVVILIPHPVPDTAGEIAAAPGRHREGRGYGSRSLPRQIGGDGRAARRSKRRDGERSFLHVQYPTFLDRIRCEQSP
jgi:hypothetical protein